MSRREHLEVAVAAAGRGATIVTADVYAARAVRRAYDLAQYGSGAQGETGPAWLTADVLPLTAWLNRCWGDAIAAGLADRPVLRPLQELVLWRRAVEARTRRLLNPSAAARSAADAWRLLHAYRIPLDESSFAVGEEPRAFYSWAANFKQELERRGFCDSATLAEAVQPHLGRLALPREIVFCGFDEPTPQLKSLMQGLEQAGVKPTVVISAERAGQAAARAVICNDPADELRAAARWARRQVEAEPNSRVGIAAPNVQAQRSAIEATLIEVLAPGVLIGGGEHSVLPFDVTLGPALTDCAVIATALQWLRLAIAPAAIMHISSLLRSPYLAGGMREAAARAEFDVALRRHGRETLSHGELAVQLANSPLRTRLNLFDHLLAQLRRLKPPARASAGIFVRLATDALAAAGWPGDDADSRPLNAAETRVQSRFSDLLSEFAALEDFLAQRSPAAMLQEFTATAVGQRVRQENAAAPVQVMGWHEVPGQQFDHLWICGMSDEAWPPRGSANPYLPREAQRAAGVPNASPELQKQAADRLLAHVLASAPDVVLSSAATEGDRDLRPAAFVAVLEQMTEDELCGAPRAAWQDFGALPALDELPCDDRAPAVAAEDIRHRGSTLVKLQSNCPFHAFGEIRLAARKMEDPPPGLDARQRGKVVEFAIAQAWRDFRDHAGLMQQTPADRARVLAGAADAALAQVADPGDDAFAVKQRALERERLLVLLEEWFRLEGQRVAFDQVQHEVETVLTLGGLGLSLRIDRLDRVVGENSWVVLDYKSGDRPLGGRLWSLPRPEDPQLPLYALAERQQQRRVAALAFAQPRPNASQFSGYGERKELLHLSQDRLTQYAGAGVSFSDHVDQWHPALEELVRNFLDGDARVDPKHGPQENTSTCRHCDLEVLCRVAEYPIALKPATNAQDDAEDGAEENDE